MRRTKGLRTALKTALKTALSMVLLLTALLGLAACRGGETLVGHVEPMTKEAVPSTDRYRLTLTDRAIERLDVQTVEVTRVVKGLPMMPYSALIYDLEGDTWVYTNPEPNVFVRQLVTVAEIQNDRVSLAEGPEVGTKVVSVAAAELYGAETGIGK